MCGAKTNVRFTPKSDRESRHPQTVMSALPPKADMCSAKADVRFGPIADMSVSLDDQVGSLQERLRNRQAKRLGSLKIDDKFNFRGLLDWKVRWLDALQNFGHEQSTAPKRCGTIDAISHQSASISK